MGCANLSGFLELAEVLTPLPGRGGLWEKQNILILLCPPPKYEFHTEFLFLRRQEKERKVKERKD